MNYKKIIVVVVTALIAVFLFYNYIIYAGARDLKTEETVFSGTALKVFEDFSTNYEVASKKYLNKAVELTGEITTADKNVITLEGKVSCQVLETLKVNVNEKIIVKGRIIGYDDLMEQVKLDQCVILK